MPDNLESLIERSRSHIMTPREEWQQRASFVFGNVHLANEAITREQVEARLVAEFGPCPSE